jgi:hypothetical protein
MNYRASNKQHEISVKERQEDVVAATCALEKEVELAG